MAVKPSARRILKGIGLLFSLGFLALVAGGIVLLYGIEHYGEDLPDFQQLADYDPPTVTRVHAGDGRLLTEYALEKRVYVPIEAIPRRIVNAFLAAEDKGFYQHRGVDPAALARAAAANVPRYLAGKRLIGASTITQQVAKNFLLSNEYSVERKIREAILALRIERAYAKDRILELYLNEIYLGFSSYGVTAAALNYFNKSLDELTLAEAAFLAALPKAPNNYNPLTRYEEAVGRRDWVIGRMLEDGHIVEMEAEEAWAEILEVRPRDAIEEVNAEYFVEEVRRELARLYGEDELYEGGLSVRTTLSPPLQYQAEKALRDGLIAYDRRHGWRGPLQTLDLEAVPWLEQLAEIEPPAGVEPWRLAVVLSLSAKAATIGLADGSEGTLPMAELTWAAPPLEDQKVGPAPGKPEEVLKPGDLVLVEPVAQDAEGKDYPEATYGLRQIPEINGAIVALDPHTGRVLAMSGGFAFAQSQFNRATQAQRQPGSAFKPFVYLAALDNGFTPSTLVMDAPFVADQGPGKPKWKPANYTRRFYGPTPMRVGIEKSRNLMTVRLAQQVGMEAVADYAERFGVVDDMPPVLAMALGSAETTLLRLTTGYAMLVNGGRRIQPTLIDRVQDKYGRTVYRHDQRICDCLAASWEGQSPPVLPDAREQIADPGSIYQVVSMLQGVVQRGTGVRVAKVGKPLAGKTGTTNESRDTWFMGFSPDLAVGVFVGFDVPRPLGPKETGSSVAAPVFRDFMAGALADKPAVPFRIPPGIRLVRVSAETGRLARAGDRRVILEAFKPGTMPAEELMVIDGSADSVAADEVADGETETASPRRQAPSLTMPRSGTGGLY